MFYIWKLQAFRGFCRWDLLGTSHNWLIITLPWFDFERREKINLKSFIFTLLYGASKGFIKSLQAFVKAFKAPQRSEFNNTFEQHRVEKSYNVLWWSLEKNNFKNRFYVLVLSFLLNFFSIITSHYQGRIHLPFLTKFR